MIRGGAKIPAGEGIVEFAPVTGFAGFGQELREARQITAEQSPHTKGSSTSLAHFGQ